MRFRPAAIAQAGVALLLATVPACSNPTSFIVLALELAPGSTAPITGVTSVVVTVARGTVQARTLTYPAPNLTIDAIGAGDGGIGTDAGTAKTLSVSFTGDETGAISFGVAAMNGNGCVVGRGTATQVIRKGAVADITVDLTSAFDCTPDGGAATDGALPDDAAFPGCDPVHPAAGAPGTTLCDTSQTCQVNCSNHHTDCVVGGSGPAGASCQSNADCQPGTQCFDYGATGCGAKICLRFCGGDSDCAAFGDGGSGPGSVCQGPVQCGTTVTAYHTCTFNCDPTAKATPTHGGCPVGLACVMPGSMDKVDCACAEATRIKTEGQACSGAAECAPGLVCNVMSGTKVCRAICRCNAVGGACSSTASTLCPTPGTQCMPVTNNLTYGVCL